MLTASHCQSLWHGQSRIFEVRFRSVCVVCVQVERDKRYLLAPKKVTWNKCVCCFKKRRVVFSMTSILRSCILFKVLVEPVLRLSAYIKRTVLSLWHKIIEVCSQPGQHIALVSDVVNKGHY